MITYILIVISLGQLTDQVSFKTFHSKVQCESAALKVNQSGLIASKAIPNRHSVLGAYCQPDGPNGMKVGAQ